MKKILFALILITSNIAYSQSPSFPDFINYQAVLRDGSGNALPAGTSGTLNFKLFDSLNAGSASYEEVHNYTTNIAGVIALQIGNGTQVSTNNITGVNWFRGKVAYEIYLNGSSTPLFPRQAFATVPYAVYALNSGNGLPVGTAGQTLYYDGTKWVPNSTLNNNGSSVGIGITAGGGGNRLHVNSFNSSDSSTIYSVKGNANGRNASIRGLTNGNTINNVSNPSLTAIYGGDFYGLNNGTGYGIGVSGVGSSSGTAAGVIGVATGGPTSTLVGVYGSAERSTYSPHNFAAVFNKGKVSIGDTLIFPYATATVGSVLTLNAQKKGVWTTLNSSSPISIAQNGIINVNPLVPSTSFTISAAQPVFSNSGIGTITPAVYPNYALNIPPPTFSSVGLANVSGIYPNYTVGVATPTLNFNITNGNLNLLQGPFSTSVNISPSLTLSGNTLSVLNSSIALPGLNLWSRVSNTATTLFNINDYVGIGVTNPSEKLQVQSGANTDISIVATPINNANLNFGSTTNHFLGKINYSTNTNNMNFWTNNVPDRLVITGSGNVGIGLTAPTEKLSVAGNVIIPGTNEYLYTSAKTKQFSMPAVAFRTEAPTNYECTFLSGCMYPSGTTPGTATYFLAPVYLPDGATVTTLDAYVVDNDANYNISGVWLWQQPGTVGSTYGNPVIMANTGASAGVSTVIQKLTTTTITNPIINNNLNSYYVRVGLAQSTTVGDIRLAKVVITYTINKAD